jgi:hypothetical protein
MILLTLRRTFIAVRDDHWFSSRLHSPSVTGVLCALFFFFRTRLLARQIERLSFYGTAVGKDGRRGQASTEEKAI